MRALVTAGAVAAAAALWGITILVGANVTLRYFGHPVVWTLEINSYLLIGVSILSAARTLLRGGHFSVSLLEDALRPSARIWLQLFNATVGLIFIALFSWGVVELIGSSIRYNLKSATLLHIPLMYPQAILAVGGVLLVIAYLLRLRDLAASLRHRDRR